MRPTRVRDLLGVGVVAALLGNLVIGFGYGALPGLPMLAGVTLGVLGVAEALFGNVLQARIRRRRGARPIQPLVAARAVLLAKASAVAGSIMAGVWVGLLVYVLPRSAEVTAAAADAVTGAIGLVCALALVGGALWLERCCRTPDDAAPTHPTE